MPFIRTQFSMQKCNIFEHLSFEVVPQHVLGMMGNVIFCSIKNL